MIKSNTDEWDSPNAKGYVWLVGFMAALGGFVFGYDTGVIAGAVPTLEKYFSMDAAQLGFSVAIVFIGSILGAFCGGVLSDFLGRRRTLIFTAFLFFLSAVLTAISQQIWQFNMARFIGGLGIGISLPIAGVYLAEIAPARVRGRVVTLNQLAITFGILISYIVGLFMSNLGDQSWQLLSSWRWSFGIEAIPAFAFMSLLFMVPESPRWLIQNGRIGDAIEVMTKVNGRQKALEGVDEIKQVIQAEDVSIFQLLKPGLRVALIIGIMLSLFDQITGINIVIYYIQKILLELGFSEGQARWGMFFLGLNNFLTTIIALSLVDRIGRKPLLMFCPLGMSACMLFIGFQFFTNALPPIFVLFSIMAYCFCYALGPGPVNLLILSEIFPTHIRGKAAGVCTIFMWVSCYFIAEKFPTLLEWSEAGTFWILATTSFLYFLFAWIVVPETRGKTLEQIEQHWNRNLLIPGTEKQST